ncbi:unnamed protein product, partial [Adineta steineri]
MRISNVPATCFENLSNELFYEIFDYLGDDYIYETFSNLNYRFQHLITCSSIPLKIKFRSTATSQSIDCCKTVVVPNRHRIRSLNFEHESLLNIFFKHCIIDSSFNRLQSIVLGNMSINRAAILLFYLKSLPNLVSLTMCIEEEEDSDLSDIYRMIFSLPSLKYNKLSLYVDYDEEDLNISIPLALNAQFSTIEYMVMNHTCTLNNLMSILCHTPRVHHLICDTLQEATESNVTNEQSIILSNLVYIRINNCEINFDRFEMFMKKVSSQLQILHIKQGANKAYLDANRWQRLIKKYIPNLHKFIYEYPGYEYNDYETTSLDTTFNQFISPFWLNKGWIFELEINNKEISFSIHPHKKIWFDVDANTDNALTRLIPTSQLSVSGCWSTKENQTFIDDFKSLFVAIQFTHLNINCEKVPIEMLIRIIQLLPNLNSLKISSLPTMPLACSGTKIVINDKMIAAVYNDQRQLRVQFASATTACASNFSNSSLIYSMALGRNSNETSVIYIRQDLTTNQSFISSTTIYENCTIYSLDLILFNFTDEKHFIFAIYPTGQLQFVFLNNSVFIYEPNTQKSALWLMNSTLTHYAVDINSEFIVLAGYTYSGTPTIHLIHDRFELVNISNMSSTIRALAWLGNDTFTVLIPSQVLFYLTKFTLLSTFPNKWKKLCATMVLNFNTIAWSNAIGLAIIDVNESVYIIRPTTPGYYSVTNTGCGEGIPFAFSNETICPPGSYHLETLSKPCALCPYGTFNSGNNSVACIACNNSSFCPLGAVDNVDGEAISTILQASAYPKSPDSTIFDDILLQNIFTINFSRHCLIVSP